jgi:hypothetical protein
VPPEVVGEALGPTVLLPSSLDLEGVVVEHEDAAGLIAVGVAERADVDAIGTAMDGVRAAVPGFLREFVGFDGLDQLRLPRVGLGVDDLDPR